MGDFDTVSEYLERLAGPVRLPFASGTSVRKVEDQIADALDAIDVAGDAALVARASAWMPVA